MRQHPGDQVLTLVAANLGISFYYGRNCMGSLCPSKLIVNSSPTELFVYGNLPLTLKFMSMEWFLYRFTERTLTAWINISRQINFWRKVRDRLIWIAITEHQWSSNIFSYLSAENKETITCVFALKTAWSSEQHRTTQKASTPRLGWGFQTCNKTADK